MLQYVSEDWRVRLTLDGGLPDRQKSLAAELGDAVGGSVRVASSGTQIFLYAGTGGAAGAAAGTARDLLAQHMVTADVQVEHWDQARQTWQGRDPAAPWDEAAEQAATAELEEQEREWSAKTGLARWQVRVELAAHHQVVALARHLAAEGWPVARRRKYLIAGANTEKDARRLAQEIPAYTSADAIISVQKTIIGWGAPDVSVTPPA
jgi:hypothetical protein